MTKLERVLIIEYKYSEGSFFISINKKLNLKTAKNLLNNLGHHGSAEESLFVVGSCKSLISYDEIKNCEFERFFLPHMLFGKKKNWFNDPLYGLYKLMDEKFLITLMKLWSEIQFNEGNGDENYFKELQKYSKQWLNEAAIMDIIE